MAALIHQLNPALRGWCNFFRPGVSSKAFHYLRGSRLEAGHPVAAPQTPRRDLEGHPPPIRRRRMVAARRQREAVQPDGGAHRALPIPGSSDTDAMAEHHDDRQRRLTGHAESWLLGNGHGRFGERAGGTD
jgi:hypothetical protein